MKAILSAILVAGALLFAAAPAKADQWDFISMLDNEGVSYTDILDMVDIGKATCHDLRMGHPIPAIGNQLVALNFPPIEAAMIITAASYTMCPDTWWRIQEAQTDGRAVA